MSPFTNDPNSLLPPTVSPKSTQPVSEATVIGDIQSASTTSIGNAGDFDVNKPWTNAIGNQTMVPLRTYKPRSLGQIISCIQQAEADKVNVRAIGSGHAFSDIGTTDGYLVFTKAFNHVLNLDPNSLNDPSLAKNLIHVEAGITIEQLIQELEKRGKGLSNMGSYTGQAIIGAISTSTHGSGIKLGGLPSMVKSLVIVTSGGKAFRLEPTNGITNKATYNDPIIPLIQNDNEFYSAVVSMGSMGVIYSLILQVEDFYDLVERRTLHFWDDVKLKLQTTDLMRQTRHFEVLINPYPSPDHAGQHLCVITRREYAPKGTALDQDGRNSYWTRVTNSLPYFSNGIASGVFRNMPSKIPGLIDSALHDLPGDYASHYYNVLRLGADAVNGYAVEIGYDLKSYFKAVDFIFDLAQRKLKEAANVPDDEKYKYYITSPFCLRFVAASDALLSPQFGRETCMIEFPFVMFPGVQVTGESVNIMNELINYSLTIGGRPHWGLEFGYTTANDIKSVFPSQNLDAWLAAYKKYNGNGTFDNTFTQRVFPPGINV